MALTAFTSPTKPFEKFNNPIPGLPDVSFATILSGGLFGSGGLFCGGDDPKYKVKIPKLGNLQFNPNPQEDNGRFSDLDFSYPEINSLFQRPVDYDVKAQKFDSKKKAKQAYADAVAMINDYYNTSGVSQSGPTTNISDRVLPVGSSISGNNSSYGKGASGGILSLNPSFMDNFKSFIPKF